MMNPASRSNTSQVTNKGITSLQGHEGRKEICPLRSKRETTATVWHSPSILRYWEYCSTFCGSCQEKKHLAAVSRNHYSHEKEKRHMKYLFSFWSG